MRRGYPNQTVLCYDISRNIAKCLVLSEPAHYVEDMCLERLMRSVFVWGKCVKRVRRSGEVDESGRVRLACCEILQRRSKSR
jgi:hypothetical protein